MVWGFPKIRGTFLGIPKIRSILGPPYFGKLPCEQSHLDCTGVKGSFKQNPSIIVTIRDNRDYIRVLLYSYYTTITGWGVPLTYYLLCMGKSNFWIGPWIAGYCYAGGNDGLPDRHGLQQLLLRLFVHEQELEEGGHFLKIILL